MNVRFGWRVVIVGVASGVLLAGAPPPAAAQDDARTLPTLESLGVGYWSNASGSIQFALSGRADVDAYVPGDDPTYLISETGTFVAPRVRLFGDLFLGDAWYVTSELRFDHGPMSSSDDLEFRVEQAFVRWSPVSILALQAGRFASPFGGYPSRHHTEADWFIRPPLMYEYRTTLLPGRVPATADAWAAWKDDASFRARGVPPVWGAPYQWGGMAFGVLRDLNWRVAYMNSAPSSGPDAWDAFDFERGNLVAALGYRFAPWLRTELSYSAGPFLERDLDDGDIPDGVPHGPDWFVQNVVGLEALFQFAHTQLRAEAFHDTWAYVEQDATDLSWSLEARQELRQDWFLAGRVGEIRFSDIEVQAEGEPIGVTADEPWDYDVRRFQIAAGYRLARNAEIRAEYLTQQTDGPVDPDDDLVSVQLWWAF